MLGVCQGGMSKVGYVTVNYAPANVKTGGGGDIAGAY